MLSKGSSACDTPACNCLRAWRIASFNERRTEVWGSVHCSAGINPPGRHETALLSLVLSFKKTAPAWPVIVRFTRVPTNCIHGRAPVQTRLQYLQSWQKTSLQTPTAD